MIRGFCLLGDISEQVTPDLTASIPPVAAEEFRSEMVEGLHLEFIPANDYGARWMKEYVLLSPVLAAQYTESLGGRIKEIEPYLNQVLLWLLCRNGADDIPAQVFVSQSGYEALCMPGGCIIVAGPLIMDLRNEAELASILAHEAAHEFEGHGARNALRESSRIGIARAFEDLANATGRQTDSAYESLISYASRSIAMIGRQVSRGDELAADSIAFHWLFRSGYNPAALSDLLIRQHKLLKEGTLRRTADNLHWLSDLQGIEARLENLQRIKAEWGRRECENGGDFKARFERYTAVWRASVREADSGE